MRETGEWSWCKKTDQLVPGESDLVGSLTKEHPHSHRVPCSHRRTR